MKFLKPKFWSKKNSLISIILLPISYLIQILIIFKRRTTTRETFDIPIICVGNIYLGGTGKTPLSIMIAEELAKNNKKPAIIKKFYSAHVDEHNLIRDRINCLFLNKKRSSAIKEAIKRKYNIIVLDDGFQDTSIKKNLNILCFNSRQLVGNGMTLPSGPLRESFNKVKDADLIVINGERNVSFENMIFNISNKIKIFYSRYVPSNIENFKGKKLLAFAGIGSPDNFFELLEKNNLNIQKKISYPDHYEFKYKDLEFMRDTAIKNNFELITTEKDYKRIEKYKNLDVNYIKVNLEILEKDKFINYILKNL